MIENKAKNTASAPLVMVCIYIFLLTDRPWESIRYLEGIPIEFPFAVLMILVGLFTGKIRVITSSTNKWVYSLLCLHYLLIPFSFNSEFTMEQSYEYAKAILLYLLMLAVVEDEFSLQILVKAFIFSMMLYMLHSLWEYHNGRHEFRQGIARMIGVDETHNDPNAFGASVVLSLPFVYVLLRSEVKSFMRKLYFSYFALAVLCVILTGSRSASIAFVFLLLLWGVSRKGGKKIWIIMLVLLSLGVVWTAMPVDKQDRIRTLWDPDSGPKVAADSAQGRLDGWLVSWEMFKQNPISGVGPGGKNFVEYRIAHRIDDIIGKPPSPSQSHNLYGQVLAEFGIPGAFLFIGLVFATWQNSRKALSILEGYSREESLFLCSLARAIMASLLLLLLLGFAGHNFYRGLWLWMAAWSGSLVLIAETKIAYTPKVVPLSTNVSVSLP